MHNEAGGAGHEHKLRNWETKDRRVNVALTSQPAGEKNPITDPQTRQEEMRAHTDDAVIHDELLNGTERKVKLWGSFSNLWFQVATATTLKL